VAGRSSASLRRVVAPEGRSASAASVEIDFVGSLENAATVISRLYRGEKRLVFCDSRAAVEEVAAGLHQRGIRTYVSHSSLGAEERRAVAGGELVDRAGLEPATS
jgi:ATP-dependent helicase Lhr and Lhr-like helicase